MKDLRAGYEIYVWGSARRREIEEAYKLEQLEVIKTPAYTMSGKVKMNYTIYQITNLNKKKRRGY